MGQTSSNITNKLAANAKRKELDKAYSKKKSERRESRGSITQQWNAAQKEKDRNKNSKNSSTSGFWGKVKAKVRGSDDVLNGRSSTSAKSRMSSITEKHQRNDPTKSKEKLYDLEGGGGEGEKGDSLTRGKGWFRSQKGNDAMTKGREKRKSLTDVISKSKGGEGSGYRAGRKSSGGFSNIFG